MLAYRYLFTVLQVSSSLIGYLFASPMKSLWIADNVFESRRRPWERVYETPVPCTTPNQFSPFLNNVHTRNSSQLDEQLPELRQGS